jgi:hypothetical protein
MNNKPTLFVSTVTNNVCGNENQSVFDSRKNIKSIVLHRLDDILALLYLGRRVNVKVSYENNIFVGEIIGVERNYIHIRKDSGVLSLLIDNITELKMSLIS